MQTQQTHNHAADQLTIEINMDYAYLYLAIKVLRVALCLLNLIVILVSVYFSITGRDLFYNRLDTHQALIIFISTGTIGVAFLGIVNAFWWGKLKEHLQIAIAYAVCVTVAVIGAIIASVYMSDVSGADIIFIILTTLNAALLFFIAWAFAYCVLKAKKFAKLKKKSLSQIKKYNKVSA